MQCVGVKRDGVRCAVMVVGEAQHIRCKTHMTTLNKVGPNQIRRDELKYTHTRMITQIYNNFTELFRGAPVDEVEYQRHQRARNASMREEEIRYQLELHGLEDIINRETDANNGVNADQPFIERRRAADQARRAAANERWRIRNNEWQQRHAAMAAIYHVAPAGGGQLAQLAHDNQNVHTAVVVQIVKETVDKILLIPVPPEYQTETLKTSGEIILECGLSKKAAWQMMAKYCQDDDIYELGYGIYGRVLNAVWQFIKASPDSADLKKILKSEMEDNIGMCAQGNLSRLCNILSGYLEGINMDIKSKNELLAERLAPLAQLANYHTRMEQAHAIFEELQIPENDRPLWLEPLQEV